MRNKFEIQVWKEFDDCYAYEEFWRGQSLMAAAWNFIKAKRAGYGCVTMHWR